MRCTLAVGKYWRTWSCKRSRGHNSPYPGTARFSVKIRETRQILVFSDGDCERDTSIQRKSEEAQEVFEENFLEEK